jgi:hypothetical protein
MASYLLEQYLDRVAALPSDLSRNYSLMRELDTLTHGACCAIAPACGIFGAPMAAQTPAAGAAEMVGKLDADCQAFLTEVASLSDADRRARLQALQVEELEKSRLLPH